MRAAVLLATLLLAACARQSAAPAILVAEAKPCSRDRVPPHDAGDWREIAGDGFTYCVPASWQPVGQRAQRWRTPSLDLEWGQADGFQRPAPFVVPTRGQSGARFGSRVMTETIDGATVRLEIQDLSEATLWSAAAAWLEPTLRVYATARTATAAAEVLGVYRSVRFGR